MKHKLLLGVGFLGLTSSIFATQTPNTLPVSQNWSDTSLITTNNIWTNVPGFQGYLGDMDSGTSFMNLDPRGYTGDDDNGSSNTVHVLAQSAPTIATGGVIECDGIADPVVGLQGSGTADAPFLATYFVTTGLQNITVTYNLRQIDTDAAPQQITAQYRVGMSGGFTNLAGTYVADASLGVAVVTPGSAVLPAAANNQSVVTVRWITTNATGSDNIIGIDDISITGTPVSSVNDWSVY